jgi:hypothetical protein
MRVGEHADQVGRAGVQHFGSLVQGDALGGPGVQQVAHLYGEARGGLVGRGCGVPT